MSDNEQAAQEEQPQQAAAPVTTQPSGGGNILQNGDKEWSTGVCGCCSDIKACCLGMFCMPCTLCNISQAIGDPMCSAFVPGGIPAIRTKVRLSYGLEGNICKDGLISYCCGPLAVCQIQRELQHNGVDL